MNQDVYLIIHLMKLLGRGRAEGGVEVLHSGGGPASPAEHESEVLGGGG